jgi:hypothetical protein
VTHAKIGPMSVTSVFRGAGVPHWQRAARGFAACAFALLAGCGTTQFEAEPIIPQPLVTRIPVVVGVHVPPAFREAVHREKRDGVEYVISVGRAQADGFDRLMNAMFARVVPVASLEAGAVTDPEVRAVFEPVLVEFSFVTPRDTGTPLYAVSLKYRINAYTPAGEAIDAWTFTGYGAQQGSSMPGQGKSTLQQAAGLAMRDAGAKIAVEFREQAIVRGLIEPTAPLVEVPVQPPPP